MPDMFETYDKIRQAISLFSSHPSATAAEAKKAQGMALLRQWLSETDLEIARFEADMENLADENYQMKLLEEGYVKW